jgi:thiol-disulfide isomerase/thioredoxin
MMGAPSLLLLGLLAARPSVAGEWRAVLDLAGGELRFALIIEGQSTLRARLCNGGQCQQFSAVGWEGDSLVLELADYAASIRVVLSQDSLVGTYHNVGRRGPRSIPFRADRGRWDFTRGSATLYGRWDAWFLSGFDQSPRILEFHPGTQGLEGTVISNAGDYGTFWGTTVGDSFAIAHFDGSYVYLLAGRLEGDTLRGTFHAGLRTRTSFVATRSRGARHLTPPSEVTRADTAAPFDWRFPDLDGRLVHAQQFDGRVLLLDLFGTWCPTCHDAMPALVELYRRYHDQGLDVVGVAFEVTGDTAQDAPLVRRFRDKFAIPFPLLLGGVSETDAVAAALPQLQGFTAYPTLVFIDRRGRVRHIHAGFYGPATGSLELQLREELKREVERLIGEE